VAYGASFGPRVQGRYYVPNSVFLKYVARARGNSYEPPDISWNDWGPENTSFSPLGTPTMWLRFCHGQRVVLPTMTLESTNGSVKTVLTVQDFNPHAALAATTGSNSEDPMSMVRILGPRPCHIKGIFREAMVTSLPLRILSRVIEGDYSAFLIDDERIIAFKTGDDFGDDFEDIAVFML